MFQHGNQHNQHTERGPHDHGDPGDHHGFGRHRHGDRGGQIGREIRDELRRNLRRGAGPHEARLFELFGRGRGGMAMRRGEIRPLILASLRQKPMHGYEVIQWLEEQSGGRWRPSAGSIYPTLQQLADEGLVTSDEVDGRRTYTLTEAGRIAADESPARSPWGGAEEGTEPAGNRDPGVHQVLMQLAAAVIQVDKIGSAAARGEAAKVLTDARKQLYRLLSEDELVDEDNTPAEATDDDR